MYSGFLLGTSLSVFDIESLDELKFASLITTGGHCFGCTAGVGSS
jgi:hypothetical protein